MKLNLTKPIYEANDLKRKLKNAGPGVQFAQSSNKEGLSYAAAKHPGNTIMSTPKQKSPTFNEDIAKKGDEEDAPWAIKSKAGTELVKQDDEQTELRKSMDNIIKDYDNIKYGDLILDFYNYIRRRNGLPIVKDILRDYSEINPNLIRKIAKDLNHKITLGKKSGL